MRGGTSHGNPQTTKAEAKTKFTLCKLTARAPLLRAAPIKLAGHGEVKLVPAWSPHPYVLVSGAERQSAGYQKRNVNTNPEHNL